MNESPELLPAEEARNAAPQVAPASGKKPKDRSPAYPGIGLRRALEHAQKLWEIEKRLPMLVQRAATNMGFSAKSSGGLLALSAMKKFGLLDEEGSGPTRKVKLSETAISLLNPSTPNKEQLLKSAALKPPIHSELWTKFGADGGSEGTMRDYLLFERGFFDEAAKSLIGQFKETITFAKLSASDKVDPPADDQDEEVADGDQTPPAPTPQGIAQQGIPAAKSPPVPPAPPTPPAKQTPPLNPALKYYAIPTDIGEAWIPMGLSEDDFKLLGDALQLFKKKIVKTSQFPAAAIWRNADQDKPVMVVGEEEKDGVKYYLTKSGTGIPESEVYFA